MTRTWTVAYLAIAGGALFAPAFAHAQNLRVPLPPRVVIQTPYEFFVDPAQPPNQRVSTIRPLAYRPIRRDQKKAERLTTLGDRFFRAKNYPRATERYEDACLADPQCNDARIGLALIAMEHWDLIEAAGRFREAEAADPGWLTRRPRDIEAVYFAPSRFADVVAKLESRVQTHPDDRDAWLLLGAHWFLSGRVKKASDIFLRLDDRSDDSTVNAFRTAIDLRLIEEERRIQAEKK